MKPVVRVLRRAGASEDARGPKGARPDCDREQPQPDIDVTPRLNKLFADPDLAREQLRTAAESDAAGTGWSGEDW